MNTLGATCSQFFTNLSLHPFQLPPDLCAEDNFAVFQHPMASAEDGVGNGYEDGEGSDNIEFNNDPSLLNYCSDVDANDASKQKNEENVGNGIQLSKVGELLLERLYYHDECLYDEAQKCSIHKEHSIESQRKSNKQQYPADQENCGKPSQVSRVGGGTILVASLNQIHECMQNIQPHWQLMEDPLEKLTLIEQQNDYGKYVD